MSELKNKLEGLMSQIQEQVEAHKETILPVLKKIGGLQSLLESYTSDSIDSQNLQNLQSKIADFNLDDSTVATVLAEIKKATGFDVGNALKEEDLSKLIDAVRQVQTQVIGTDSLQVSEIVPVLQKLFSQAESLLLTPIDLLKKHEGSILKMLEKL